MYTTLLEQVRHQALQRLADHAKNLGANAVVSVGFDTAEMGGSMTEVLAYGTAVVVEPETQPAQPVALHRDDSVERASITLERARRAR